MYNRTTAPAVGLSGPTGQFLYNWIPDSLLSLSCDNTPRSNVVIGSACDHYLTRQDALYPKPPMPVAPAPPVGLPQNPLDRVQAEAAVQAVIDDRARRQAQATQDFYTGVADGLEDYNNRKSSNLAWLGWALVAVGVVVTANALKR